MCMQCVAQSLPYVGLAIGGLRVMAWKAGRERPADVPEPDPDRTVAMAAAGQRRAGSHPEG